eukprot:CAMPEP_0198152836 /NCGR_PEP_ID=MMETSP1443-20131203/61513_1 /TAXON_ID=186043 /ORGANISM="Entomoneis sp., Strain CCMP2396" /LENGTH=71 /DNA_ID=CAMNT_0043818969 /DNA_START=110 /DNA_END=325 /DNA_ORIENTATION=-
MAKAKNQVSEGWKNSTEAFSQWYNADNANTEQRKERDERTAEFEEKQAERAERKSKLSSQWAANKSQNSSS